MESRKTLNLIYLKKFQYMKRVNLTKHRKTIYNIIFDSGEHLSVDEIIAILKRKDLKISRATVFNSLNFLESNNYLKSFSIFGSKKSTFWEIIILVVFKL